MYVEESRRCLRPHLTYCFVLTPTGPMPLSAERIVMFAFCLISFSSVVCSRVKLVVVFCRRKFFSIHCEKCRILLSISKGGRGARHVDLPRSALGSYDFVESSPTKYI